MLLAVGAAPLRSAADGNRRPATNCVACLLTPNPNVLRPATLVSDFHHGSSDNPGKTRVFPASSRRTILGDACTSSHGSRLLFVLHRTKSVNFVAGNCDWHPREQRSDSTQRSQPGMPRQGVRTAKNESSAMAGSIRPTGMQCQYVSSRRSCDQAGHMDKRGTWARTSGGMVKARTRTTRVIRAVCSERFTQCRRQRFASVRNV